MCQNWGAKPGQIADGASFTILFNEVRVGVSAKDRRGTWAMGMAGSSITCGNALEHNPSPNDTQGHPFGDQVQGCAHFWYPEIGRDGMGCVNWGAVTLLDYSRRGQARSRHPVGVNACFADGGVRFVRNDINIRVWRAMLTRDGNMDTEDKPYRYDF